ncbi:MAG: glutathione S-transferase family protein [Hyphomicrobium sp.]|nr:glutathione S-transferase family protein [Hyphomicrobium sp.]
MSGELVFYTHPMSRGRIARWMLEEIGQPYQTEILGFGPQMKNSAYRAINPLGKVPALQHKGVTITECAAICAYLADAFADANLAPALNDPARGTYYRWMFFAAGPIETTVLHRALKFTVPEDKRGMAGAGTVEDVTAALESAVSHGPYVCGDQFTAADVYLGSQLFWAMSFGMIEKKPAFEAYWSRLKDRPAHLRATDIDDAIIAAQKTAG